MDLKDCSAGSDAINVSFLKTNIDFFAEFLSDKVNEVFLSGEFPDSLKIASVVPVFKGGDSTNCGNYRPISILPIFSKVFEICIKTRLLTHLENTKFLDPGQFGFLKGSSTVAAISEVVDVIVSNLNSSLKTSSLFVDLRKAFDSASHKSFEGVFAEAGISGVAKKLMLSYLSNRKQQVKVNDSRSSFLSIKLGVAQGSILGPILFLMYINGVFSLKLKGKAFLYADDLALVYGKKNFGKLKRAMKHDIRMLKDWLATRNLQINSDKTKFIIFTPKNLNVSEIFSEIVVDCLTITSVDSYEYLGLVIDKNLRWKLHIESVCKKVIPYIGAIKRIKRFLKPYALLKLYYAFIQSNLLYGISIWGNSAGCHLRLLQSLQNKVVRYVLGLPHRFPSEELYSETLMNVRQLFCFHSVLFIFKAKNGLTKCNKSLMTNLQITGRNTRSSTNLRLPNYTRNYSQSTLFYKGINLYNDLPQSLKQINNLNSFKSKLKIVVHNKY